MSAPGLHSVGCENSVNGMWIVLEEVKHAVCVATWRMCDTLWLACTAVNQEVCANDITTQESRL